MPAILISEVDAPSRLSITSPEEPSPPPCGGEGGFDARKRSRDPGLRLAEAASAAQAGEVEQPRLKNEHCGEDAPLLACARLLLPRKQATDV